MAHDRLPDTPAAIDAAWLTAAARRAVPGCQGRLRRRGRDPRADQSARPASGRLRRGRRRAAGHVLQAAAPRPGPAGADRRDGDGPPRGPLLRRAGPDGHDAGARPPISAGTTSRTARSSCSSRTSRPPAARSPTARSASQSTRPPERSKTCAACTCASNDPARRQAEAPWVPVAAPGSDYGAAMLRDGIDHHRDRLTDDFSSRRRDLHRPRRRPPALWHEGRAR